MSLARPRRALPPGPARAAAGRWPVRLGLLGLLGAGMGLGQAPSSLPLLALAALALALAAYRRGAGTGTGAGAGAGRAFAAGWALGAGHFALTLRWITEPFLVDAAVHGWMAPFALLLCAGGFALFWGAAWGLAARLRLGLAGLVALWAAAEALRSLVLTGFPWALIGHAWIGAPPMQAAAWVGPHGLTLLTLGLAALVARLGLSPWQAAPAAALALAWVALDPGPPPAPDPAAPVVRLVQPDVPQREKWDPLLIPVHRARLLALSGGPGADLVVWPETALAEPLDRAGPTLAEAARAAGAPLVTGLVRREGARWFNSLVVTDAAGAPTGLYDKAHLVPFGEYVPLGDVLGRLGVRGMAARDGDGFSAGPGPRVLTIPGIGPAMPLICYEGIFAEEVGAVSATGEGRPRLLLLVTNDAWFGDRAGPEQHLALARLRAVEQGLPLLRAANTGISAVIDARGRVLASLPLGEAGVIEAALPPVRPPTPYARFGDAPAFTAMALLLALALWRRGVDPVPRRP